MAYWIRIQSRNGTREKWRQLCAELACFNDSEAFEFMIAMVLNTLEGLDADLPSMTREQWNILLCRLQRGKLQQ